MMQALWIAALLVSQFSGGTPQRRTQATPAVLASQAVGAIAGDERVLIKPPIKAGEKPSCDREPDTAEILRALPKLPRGVPGICEQFREDVEIVKEKLVDKVDPPRFYPLVGPAQTHHCQWKCTVYFTEIVEVAYPFPAVVKRRRAEVVYIDKDHLHLYNTTAIQPRNRIVACWDERVHSCSDTINGGKIYGLKGTVYLFHGQTSVAAKGVLLVEMCDASGRKLAAWEFDAATLERLQRMDQVGVGHTLFLPCEPPCLAAKDVRVKLTYRPTQGAACSDEPMRLTLRCDAVPTQHKESDFRPTKEHIDSAMNHFRDLIKRNEIPRALEMLKELRKQDPDNVGLLAAEQLCKVRLRQQEVEAEGQSARVVRAEHKVYTGQQVQMDVVIARVDRKMLARLICDVADCGAVRDDARVHAGVTRSHDEALKALKDVGEIMSQPRVVTMSGQEAKVFSGGEVPMLAGGGAAYKPVGTRVQLLPTVMPGGHIQLELSHEYTTAESATRSGKVRGVVKSGQTFVVHCPGSKQDVVMLVTPRLVEQPTTTSAAKQLSLDDIARLVRHGLSDDIIVRHMEQTESTFTLTTDDLLSLRDQGVSNNVIRAMQERRPR